MGTLQTSDGVALHRSERLPVSGPPRAVVLLVHGLGEHVGRYAWLTERLLAAGFAVHGYDQRGHGRSPGPRGAMPQDTTLLADLALVIDAVRAQHPALPLVLLGHSMGGVLAARLVAESLSASPAPWSRPVDRLVLSSPALAADVTLVQRLLLALGGLMPDRAANNGLDAAAISRDPAVVRAYLSDPLVHDRITPRLGRWILRAGEAVRAAAPQWRTPTLLMWAGSDRCVAPRGSRAFADAAPAEVVSAGCFEPLYHEIFNEPEREDPLSTLLAWLDVQLPPAAA